MNRYHILSFITVVCNVILGFSFIFLIDELRLEYYGYVSLHNWNYIYNVFIYATIYI